ncbi:hypothetical protein CSKR_104931 [Clonorchis sinensis]|uniref:Uncharacterized protein n=1 Tax=Clonorchis sinensis TaxID=79923 RepID=A0A419Q6N4_CLOSI|nr:hypothetical protein CSKR_104931 [Clonorchis sinensis]
MLHSSIWTEKVVQKPLLVLFDSFRANVISNVNGTLSRGHRVSEANVAHAGNLHAVSRRGDYSEGYVATRGQAVIAQHVPGGDIGSGRIVNRNGISSSDIDGSPRQAMTSASYQTPGRSGCSARVSWPQPGPSRYTVDQIANGSR